MSKTFFITTTLPYVNSDPHVGFAMEIVRADAIARYKKLMGYEVFFNTGTDEHGLKIYRKAMEAGKEPQKYADEYAEKFKNLKGALGLLDDVHFIRTTDEHHIKAAQEFWKLCDKNGYIYKKNYKVKYCVGCELEKTESELVNGRCPIHTNLELEIIDEENYFFKFSEFQKRLLDFYGRTPDFVIPDVRFGEIKAFVSRGLEDFSVSRLKSKMPWGVPVPGDSDHVQYVWMDALVNYISTLGWPEDKQTFEKFWLSGEPTQYCGKDNLRQQAAMWQAMLMATGLPNSRHIIIDGFVTSGGQKMSKSLGNVIDPYEVVEKFGTDALRYIVLRELHPFEDSDLTMDRIKELFNANLANGLGNLVSRVMKMAEQNGVQIRIENRESGIENEEKEDKYTEAIEKYDLKAAMDFVWDKIQATDRRIQERQPFKMAKTEPEKAKIEIEALVGEIYLIGELLQPFLPQTAEKILRIVQSGKMIETPLFPRKD